MQSFKCRYPVPTTRKTPQSLLLRPMASGVTNIMRHACCAVTVPRNATDCIEARGSGLDFSAILCYRIIPLLWSGVALARCAKTVPTAASFLSSQVGLPVVFGSPAFFFSGLKYGSSRFDVDHMPLLRCFHDTDFQRNAFIVNIE